MKNIYLNIFTFNKNTLKKTVSYLKKNHVVGVPTETVYGLAGNAYSKKSIEKIYRIKKRPKKNPLIVHYLNMQHASKDVVFNQDFIKLYKKFCPGPLTFVLKKKVNTKINKSLTANLKTVAIRFPNHKAIRLILKKINFPLAIPSANQFSSISPVIAKDVYDEFGNKLKLIIDGGSSKIGIESTVIDLSGKIKILRLGAISPNTISKFLKKKIIVEKNNKLIKAPGAQKKHYSPNIPMKLNQNNCLKNCAFITFGKKYKKGKNTFNLSYRSNLKEAASNLYKIFRKIKKLKYKKIHVVKIPNNNIGLTINDRLKRAAYLK
tara:strand:- start:635 stop:1594 length:960 start_codon:yes stop_codon:yes gene_type:complete